MITFSDDVTLDRLFFLQRWDVLCALFEQLPLEVLGPKCTSADCLTPARVRVWLPTIAEVPPLYCEPCADWALKVYRQGFGISAVKTERLEYQLASDDDAARRFALMELR